MKRSFASSLLSRCLICLLLFLPAMAGAQTTTFTYQGRLNDASVPQPTNGAYDFRFTLWSADAGGTQLPSGSPIVVNRPNVQVQNGVFTVQLDFGAAVFNGAARFLEVSAKKASDPTFILFPQRQELTSSVHTVRALSAGQADGLSTTNCILCVTDAQIAGIAGSKVTGTVANATNAVNATNATNAVNATNATNSVNATNATNATTATTATTATNVSGVVAIANGGTGATAAPAARTALGLGPLSTWTATATPGYLPKYLGPIPVAGIVNSAIQENSNGNVSVNIAPLVQYRMYVYQQQLTVNGDGQASLHGYRTRDSQNDGMGYAQSVINSAVLGYNFWGDLYTFGVSGINYNDYTRTGGVLGAEVSGTYWGSLGYRSSGLLNYGVYGSSGYASGGGVIENNERTGIGGGFFGSFAGALMQGDAVGHISSGSEFAAYNLGNVYTSGATADVVALRNDASGKRAAAYANTSTGLKVYENGSAQMTGESVRVSFPPAYAGLLGGVPDVTVTPIGAPAQLYIKEVSADGFVVAAATPTTVRFSWIAVGARVDAERAAALPPEVAQGDFDTRMRAVLYDDGRKDRSAAPIWHDGDRVRFDRAPEPPRATKVELTP